jgi:hypothetical protein
MSGLLRVSVLLPQNKAWFKSSYTISFDVVTVLLEKNWVKQEKPQTYQDLYISSMYVFHKPSMWKNLSGVLF